MDRKDSDKKYRQSVKGKNTVKRYNHNTAGINSRIRYQLSDTYLKKHLRLKYGMSLDDYYALSAKQNNVCAICNKPNRNGARLCVDHDHKTQKIRGLLCTNCNSLLGLANDDTLIFENAIKYIDMSGENGELLTP